MKNRLLLFSLIMLLACPNSFSKRVKTNSNNGRNAYYAEMKKMVAGLNKMFPAMNYDGTMTDHIAFDNNTLIVYYKCDREMVNQLKELGILEKMFEVSLNEMAANFLKTFKDMSEYFKDGSDYFNRIKKYKTSLIYKYSCIDDNIYFYQKNYTFDEWLSLYNNRVLSKAHSVQYSLALYKDIIDLYKINLPQIIRAELEKHDINFIGNDLYIDWYIDESIPTEKLYKELSRLSLDSLYENFREFDLENGFKAYKIKVHNRFYSKQTKTLLRDYTFASENNF